MPAPGPAWERLRPLLDARSVAVVGDSPRLTRGAQVHEQLIRRGFTGRLFPVNPRYEEVRGATSYPDLASLPERVDLVLVATPVETVPGVVDECARLGVGAVIVLASGFADAGEEGRLVQERLGAVASEAGMLLGGPNCYGVANLLDRMVAYSAPLPDGLGPGPLALVAQSGALTHGLVDFAVARGCGLGYLVTTGNEAGLDVPDYLDAFADDPRVTTVALYVESVRRGGRFLESLEHLADVGKQAVIVKSGRSEAGRRATAAHTGAVASDDRVWDALLRSVGAVRVYDLAGLVETALACTQLPSTTTGPPFFASLSGAAASLVADLADDAALPLVQAGRGTAEALAELLPSFATVSNPLDLTGVVADRPSTIGAVLAALDSGDERFTPVVMLNSPCSTSVADRELYAKLTQAVLDASAGDAHRPRVVATMLPGQIDPGVLGACREHGIPVIAGMRDTIVVFRARQVASEGRADWTRSVAETVVAPRLRADVAGFAARHGDALIGEGRAKELLAMGSVAVPELREVRELDEALAAAAEIGYPVVLKVDDPEIPHKARSGCVALDLRSDAQLAAAYRRLVANAARVVGDRPVRTLVVEEQCGDGLDLFVGVFSDEEVDPVLFLGLGGALVESGLCGAGARLPVDERVAERLIGEAGLSAAIAAADPSGQATAALVRLMCGLSSVVSSLGPGVRAVDVNPVRITYEQPCRVLALDALVERAS